MLGISGLAIGFAFKDIFQNFLAGIILLITRPFELGDQIAAGGFEGTVEAIETRATTIRTYDGRRVVIPNSTLFTEPLSVNTAFGQLQSEYEIHVKADQDLDQARNRLRDAISAVAEVLRDPPGARVARSKPRDGGALTKNRSESRGGSLGAPGSPPAAFD